ncbi:metal ABC transporter permease [Gorillibacterium sp. sgz5001074]|uniref:metal ABC transporter permease n=1 Tax=Gorillibacterium sp. sgz5001074 TaxID=3446695 RepID=UPI003F67A39A
MDIFTELFFQRALIGGILIGITAPLLGIFLVLRRLSMIGDTLSHVSIAGVALGFIIHVYPVAMGLIFALLASFAIEKLRRTYRTYAELSIAIIMSGGVALAAFLFTMGKNFNLNVTSYMFGSILTLDTLDLWLVAAVTVMVAVFMLLNHKEVFLLAFDEDAAGISGLPVRLYNIIITMLTALVISVAIKIVGALLVSALITIPVASSLMVARSFRGAVWAAVVYSEIGVIGGLCLAGVGNYAPGASVVLLLIAMLILTLLVKRGLKVV